VGERPVARAQSGAITRLSLSGCRVAEAKGDTAGSVRACSASRVPAEKLHETPLGRSPDVSGLPTGPLARGVSDRHSYRAAELRTANGKPTPASLRLTGLAMANANLATT
jgi:hypothetical protein